MCDYLQGTIGTRNGLLIDVHPNDDIQNYPFCKLQIVVETFRHSNESTNQKTIKESKVVKLTSKKTLSQNFGDYCIKQPNVPSLPGLFVKISETSHTQF